MLQLFPDTSMFIVLQAYVTVLNTKLIETLIESDVAITRSRIASKSKLRKYLSINSNEIKRKTKKVWKTKW